MEHSIYQPLALASDVAFHNCLIVMRLKTRKSELPSQMTVCMRVSNEFSTYPVTSVGPNNLEPLVKVVTRSFGPLVQGGVYSIKYLVLRLPLRVTYIHQIFRDIRIDPKMRPKGIEPAANRNR